MVAAMLTMILAAGAAHPQGVQVVPADAQSVGVVWVKGHQRELCHLAREGGCFFELAPGPAVLVLEGQDIAIDVARGVSRFAFHKGPAVLFNLGLLGVAAGMTVGGVSMIGFILTIGSGLSLPLFGVAMLGILAVMISIPVMAVGLLLPRGELKPVGSPSPAGFVAEAGAGAPRGGV